MGLSYFTIIKLRAGKPSRMRKTWPVRAAAARVYFAAATQAVAAFLHQYVFVWNVIQLLHDSFRRTAAFAPVGNNRGLLVSFAP